jgi:hypothetical protein
MKTIWKFPLKIVDHQLVTAPAGMQPLCVDVQNGIPCLWAMVDPSREKVQHPIFINGTGHPVRHQGHYISTFQMHDGALVFHAFVDELVSS